MAAYFDNKAVLFQHNTLGALMEGLFAGTLSMKELLEFGNLGIGTLDDFDGELIILDGIGYQCRTNGDVIKLSGDELVPYAAVADFDLGKAKHMQTSSVLSDKTIKLILPEMFASKNLFHAVMIKGTFTDVTVRAVPKQDRPYPRLIEASQNQALFSEATTQGTVMGFYTPEIFANVAAPGFHLHFISDDRQFGGHLFDFNLTDGEIFWQHQDAFLQNFPTQDSDFLDQDISLANLSDEIAEAEE
ncbi:hypothetical protein AWM75_07255 [Aerococcus urinaehominis]|uniref:Alpha-acetolactate decarboxylase n=1 Tax=Aerococcus urinaehominis TaxID=128944 RepID=A0A0X8FN84_9LACT|nr:acetolactate decarboxylase [Aerococcus urinaehominis]AMB99772.1 hypothetical protein AWM75_07255 [Aerococcus urinaehominis]SDM09591.1 acetolactate decarboxylase [Aerococcus urinaehominis]